MSLRHFKWELSVGPLSEMLHRYLDMESGVQGTGWDRNDQFGVNSMQIACKPMGEIMQGVNIKGRNPGWSSGANI